MSVGPGNPFEISVMYLPERGGGKSNEDIHISTRTHRNGLPIKELIPCDNKLIKHISTINF